LIFPAQKPRARHYERNLWMTMDSELSGDPERKVADRWKVPGRIAGTLRKFRPDVLATIAQVANRDGLKRVVEWHRLRLVKNAKRAI
jgi:hypothetical protein